MFFLFPFSEELGINDIIVFKSHSCFLLARAAALRKIVNWTFSMNVTPTSPVVYFIYLFILYLLFW